MIIFFLSLTHISIGIIIFGFTKDSFYRIIDQNPDLTKMKKVIAPLVSILCWPYLFILVITKAKNMKERLLMLLGMVILILGTGGIAFQITTSSISPNAKINQSSEIK